MRKLLQYYINLLLQLFLEQLQIHSYHKLVQQDISHLNRVGTTMLYLDLILLMNCKLLQLYFLKNLTYLQFLKTHLFLKNLTFHQFLMNQTNHYFLKYQQFLMIH